MPHYNSARTEAERIRGQSISELIERRLKNDAQEAYRAHRRWRAQRSQDGMILPKTGNPVPMPEAGDDWGFHTFNRDF